MILDFRNDGAMISIRAAAAFAALLMASVPALGLRMAEWSIDPRADLDEAELVGRLQEVLSSDDIGIPPDLPFRVGVEIGVDDSDGRLDLVITSADLDADLTVTSTVRTTPSTRLETVVAALVADLGYLQAARAGFPPPIYLPPDITDVIDGGRIAELIRTVDQATGDAEPVAEPQFGQDAQILDLAAHEAGVSVLLTGGSAELGPRFELIAATPASLLPGARPPGVTAPQEIARTSWTHDMLAIDLNHARIVRRRSGESDAAFLDLPAGARRLDAVPGGGLAALTRNGPAYVRLTERAIEQRPVPVAAPFITAMDIDYQRRMVLYDQFDRRIVIAGLDGREIGSIRPQVDPRMLPFPHALAVLADGTVLLGGSGLVWAFDELGRPRWLLTAPLGGRETLPAQFVLEPAPGEDAFYLLDGPRTRILRFSAHGAGGPDDAVAASGPIEIARQLAELALSDAVASREWGDLPQANDRANLAVELYEYALGLASDDQASQAGLERAVDVRGDAESVIFQEPFLVLSPDRLTLAAAELQSPVNILVQVENPGVVARTGVSLLAAGVRVPVGRIEPGEQVEVMLDLPESLLITQESIYLDVGVVISADEPGGSAPRRMFVILPLTVSAPPWEQVVAGTSSPPG
jgi:hypothetical protein